MKKMIQLEEAAQLLAALVLLYLLPLHFSWWIWILLFLAPDVSMIGYLSNTRTGSVLYNLFHHKAVAFILLVIGILSGDIAIQAAGLLLWGHASMDRVLGYGLKFPDDFKHTHLGMIGKKQYNLQPKDVEEPGNLKWHG